MRCPPFRFLLALCGSWSCAPTTAPTPAAPPAGSATPAPSATGPSPTSSAAPPDAAPFDPSAGPAAPWLRTARLTERSLTRALAVAADGSVVAGTSLDGTLERGWAGAPPEPPLAVTSDAQLVAFDPQGALRWQRLLRGDRWEQLQGSAFTGDGRIEVAGTFGGTARWDDRAATSGPACPGEVCGFWATLGADGAVLAHRVLGGPGRVFPAYLAITQGGDVLITGWFYGSIDFDPGPGEVSRAAGGRAAFVARYRPDGSIAGVEIVDGGFATGAAVAATPDGGVVVGGNFGRDATFAGAETRTAIGQEDAFLLRLRPDGTLAWVRTWGSDKDDAVDDVAVFPDGSVAAVGYGRGAMRVDTPRGPLTVGGEGDTDAFVARFAPGGELLWMRAWGGAEGEVAKAVAVDPRSGDLLVGAAFGSTLELVPGAPLTKAGDLQDGLLARVAGDDGTVRWARALGLPGGHMSTVDRVAWAPNGWPICAGTLSPPTPSPTDSRWDVFVAAVSPEGTLPALADPAAPAE